MPFYRTDGPLGIGNCLPSGILPHKPFAFLRKSHHTGGGLLPEAAGTMTGVPFSMTETQLLVVPRSIPIALLIWNDPILSFKREHMDFTALFLSAELSGIFSAL